MSNADGNWFYSNINTGTFGDLNFNFSGLPVNDYQNINFNRIVDADNPSTPCVEEYNGDTYSASFGSSGNNVIFSVTGAAPTGSVLGASIFSVPTTTDVEAGVGSFSLWVFGALLLFVLTIAGILIGGMFAGKFGRAVVSSVSKVAGTNKSRYRYTYNKSSGGRPSGYERY
jgi:hypothetical protein